jgi:hypothetical protein
METFRLENGFRPRLERATRIEEDTDWSVHTVDYVAFKRKVRYFSKRRTQLRTMLAASSDNSILASEMDPILGPPPELPPNMGNALQAMLLPTSTSTSTGTPKFGLGLGGRDSSYNSNSTDLINLDLNLPSDEATSYVPFNSDTPVHVLTNKSAATFQAQEQSSAVNDHDHDHIQVHLQVPVQVQVPATVPNSKYRFWGAQRMKRRTVMRQVSNFERNDLVIFLANEMEKVVMFYLAQWQNLSQQLIDYNAYQQDLQQQQLGTSTYSYHHDPRIVALGHEILELEAFCVINIVVVRQLLIRYDAFARSFEGTPMLHYYMKMTKSEKSLMSFRKLLQHEELHALAESFVGLCQENLELATKFQQQRQEFQQVLESSEHAEATSSAGHAAPIQDTFMQTLRYYFLLGMIEDRLGYEPTYLVSRGSSLTKEMQTLADWRRDDHQLTKQIHVDRVPPEPEKEELSRQEKFNLGMALGAAFLYCMNYYIVEPSSTMYVNELGAQDAMAGTLIGMMPIASFLSAIVYSVWTNHSFREPFLLSCSLLLGGNILYAAAYNYKSVGMALAGRFLTGLGGPKVIIRRYMADTTSLNIRTSVNAGFGMVVAAGSALGPGCAILLNKLDFSIPLPNGGEIWLNGMTGPGYFMALLWTFFWIALYADFQEPDRLGLEEQKRGDASNNSPKSAHSTSPTTSPHESDRDIAIDKFNFDGAPSSKSQKDDDLMTIFSGATTSYESDWRGEENNEQKDSWYAEVKRVSKLVTFPVWICLGLLFAKVFVIETLVSATSTLSKNRYQWQVHEVGTLGCVNGFFVIPLSILVGRLSMSYQDRALMRWLLSIGLFGVILLIDISDLISSESTHYNEGQWLAVGEARYVTGYFITYISIQSFEGIIGSALSKIIPTALASGTLNSGLLATLVDTFGRSCGDLFISLVAYIDLRQLMNLLFIPGALILITCLLVVRRYYDLLAV